MMILFYDFCSSHIVLYINADHTCTTQNNLRYSYCIVSLCLCDHFKTRYGLIIKKKTTESKQLKKSSVFGNDSSEEEVCVKYILTVLSD